MVETTYTRRILDLRKSFDKNILESPDSPLTESQKTSFKGITWFPLDEKYKLEAKMEQNETPQETSVALSHGDEKEYLKFGILNFKLDNLQFTLTVFKPIGKDYFLIPFKDNTAGKETYDGGRFVPIKIINNNIYNLDFNMAYNPNCVYNEDFNCILPPKDNFLPFSITAGQKMYRSSD